ncbi:MAG TPA: hypothetical protein DC053_00560 [Lachnoclostridium sp.]|nr:hypothetical protein [Lachnoclostridium sp.]
MEANSAYEIVKRKMYLVNYIYYLQYEMEQENICVETPEAIFMVWDGSTFKVNGEESTADEFYEMLNSLSKKAVCNGEVFECVNGKYESVEPLNIRQAVYSNIIQL